MTIANASQYCAFLRGVNVKGTHMKMAEVCALFTELGMKEVSSVLASGNILFASHKKPVELKPLLEQALSNYFHYEAFLFIKSKDEIESIVKHCPYELLSNFHIYGFVGIEGISQTLAEAFKHSAKTKGETGKLVGGTFYWKVPKGNTLESEFGKILGKKNLKDHFTSRNMNTFEKIFKKF